MTRIIIVDAHPIFRMGVLHLSLQRDDLRVVAETGSADDALFIARETLPHVLVVGTNLPSARSVRLAEEVADRLPAVRVVCVAEKADAQTIFELIGRRVSGIVLKSDSPSVFFDVIMNVAEGRAGIFSASVLDVMRRQKEHRDSVNGVGLSRREIEVLRLVAQGYRNSLLAETLFISPNTVRNHMASIFEKLGVHRRAEAVSWAWTNGVIHTPEPVE